MKKTRDLVDLFPVTIDGIEYDNLRSAVREKHPAGVEGYATVYSRVMSGWPVLMAVLLPPRPKEA